MSAVSSLAGQLGGAEGLALPALGSVSIHGETGPGHGNLYELTAAARGTLTLSMQGAGGLDAYLQVYDASGRRIALNDNLAIGTRDARVRLSAAEGQMFYVLAGDRYDRPGAYALTAASVPVDDYGNDLAGARKIALNGSGRGSAAGTVNYAGDQDVFTFIATKTGVLWAEMTPRGSSGVQAAGLAGYAADETVLAADAADDGQGQRSAVRFDVTAGQTYYLAAAGPGGSRGAYTLTLSTVLDYGAAEPSAIQPVGDTVVEGVTGPQGRGILYAVTAPATGSLTILLGGAGGATDPYLEVYDANDRLIARNDNYTTRTRDSRVQLSVKEGVTYYVLAASKNGKAGAYALTAKSKPVDDYGNDFASAKAVTFLNYGTTALNGAIQYALDVDVFAVRAPKAGRLTVDLGPRNSRSLLDGDLAACRADGQTIATDAQAGPAQVTVDLAAGETVYVRASGHLGSTGAYRLALRLEERPQPAPPPDIPDPGSVITTQVRTTDGGLQLVVIGTDGNDVITLSQSDAAMALTTPAGTQQIDGAFSSLVVYGFAGDDWLRTTWTVAAGTWIYAGDGDDQVFDAGPGAAVLDGGEGRDLLVALGGGTDQLIGGGGLDSLWYDAADGVLDASADETRMGALHRVAGFYQPYTTDPGASDYVPLEIAGQNLRDPLLTSAAARYANFSNIPVFADGPQYNDIAQGAVGDCYFLAALASLADTDPDLIREMVAPLGDGTYAVRFYRSGQAQYLRLDADLPTTTGGSLVYARLGRDGELWVPLAEKAYAYFRSGQNSYASIHAGWMSTVYTEVTNLSAGTVSLSGLGTGSAQYIAQQLQAGHAVTLGSKTTSGPVVGSHAYMVKSVETAAEGTFVTVYNPWGYDGRTWDSLPSDGLLRIAADLLPTLFSSLAYSSA